MQTVNVSSTELLVAAFSLSKFDTTSLLQHVFTADTPPTSGALTALAYRGLVTVLCMKV